MLPTPRTKRLKVKLTAVISMSSSDRVAKLHWDIYRRSQSCLLKKMLRLEHITYQLTATGL